MFSPVNIVNLPRVQYLLRVDCVLLKFCDIFRCLYVSTMESSAVSMFAHVVNIMNLVGSA